LGGETTTTAVNTTFVDSLATVVMDVTYLDGTTVTFSDVLMFQTADGDLFLANSGWVGGDIRGPDMKLIQSINVTSVTESDYTGIIQNEFQSFACYVAGSRIDTPEGRRPIEELALGDLVVTRDHGAQPIRWIGEALVVRSAATTPVRITAGALGEGVPERDLLVSQQHRMLVRSPIFARMTGRDEAFVAAKTLTRLPGVEMEPALGWVRYVHLMFDHHEVIYADGAPSESLLAGMEGRKMMGPKARAEISALFPEITRPEFKPHPARPILTGKRRTNAIERHAKNQKFVFQATASGSRTPGRMTAGS
ncbi:MAG: Hint domain-containing protein, partial [Roseobacter sp.]